MVFAPLGLSRVGRAAGASAPCIVVNARVTVLQATPADQKYLKWTE